jgi:outer membrane protein assembly factor BamB
MQIRSMWSRPGRCGAIGFVLAVVASAIALAGCGGSGGEGGSGGASSSKAPGLIAWPYFGRVPERTQYLPERERALNPPLKQAWSINTHALIEFPPAVIGGIAYVVNKYGDAKAVRLRDRKVLWERNPHPRDTGTPTDVTAPVYHEGKVFFADVDGDLLAVDAKSGKAVWDRKIPGHLESSPVAVGGRLYLGTDTTNLLAVRAADGKVLWQFNSPGAIRASPSYHDGRVYVADYESGVFCLDARTGRPIWRTNTSKVAPFGRGGFFSSPAIAFGRVYAGRDDGTIYAFDARSGRVEWTFQTHNFVYGSPAVAKVPGTPPSVYIGSYDEHFYALDARTGRQRWRYDLGGPVPGTATVIGHTVYTSSFKTQETVGIDVRTHHKTFALKQAGYTPMVSDGRRLYLIGYYTLIGLQPSKP